MAEPASSVVGDEPYCGNCGYQLTGLTDSSKCPECGKPLVEVLRRKTFGPRGKRYRSKATLFGWPVVDIAIGPGPKGGRGKARGIIAIGDFAFGGIAIGGLACGVLSIGGMSLGLFAIGGGSIGLITALGGWAIGTLAFGGSACGFMCAGGSAIGYFAQGGGAFGHIVRDARHHGWNAFKSVSWFFGNSSNPLVGLIQPFVFIALTDIVVAGTIGMLAWRVWIKTEKLETAKPAS